MQSVSFTIQLADGQWQSYRYIGSRTQTIGSAATPNEAKAICNRFTPEGHSLRWTTWPKKTIQDAILVKV